MYDNNILMFELSVISFSWNTFDWFNSYPHLINIFIIFSNHCPNRANKNMNKVTRDTCIFLYSRIWVSLHVWFTCIKCIDNTINSNKWNLIARIPPSSVIICPCLFMLSNTSTPDIIYCISWITVTSAGRYLLSHKKL